MLIFIWGNSVLPKPISRFISLCVTNFLKNIFWTDGIDGSSFLSVHFIRKSAHVIEFMILGILSGIYLNKKKIDKMHFYSIAFGVIIAIIDETLQIFSLRGAASIDVVIDLFGYVIGYLISVFSIKLLHKRRLQ